MTILFTSALRKNLSAPESLASDEAVGQLCSFIDSNHQKIQSLTGVLRQNISTLEKQKIRCADVIALLEEAGGISVRTRNFVITPTDAEKYRDKTLEQEKLYTDVLRRLDRLVAQAVDDGINLLQGQTMTIEHDGTVMMKMIGIALDTASLGIRPPDFSTFINVQNARIDVMNAMDMVVTLRNTIASDIMTLSIRLHVAEESIETARAAQNILLHNDSHESETFDALLRSASSVLHDEPLAEPAQHDILMAFSAIPTLPPRTEE